MATKYALALSEWIRNNGLAGDEYINISGHDGTYSGLKSAFRDPHPSRNTIFPTQAELDAIWVEIEPTINLETQAEQARKALSEDAKASSQLLPLIKLFNDAFEGLRQSSTMTLGNVYTAWRTIYDAQDSRVKTLINDYTTPFSLPFDFTEPNEVTDDYRVAFNIGIRNFMETIINRSQM